MTPLLGLHHVTAITGDASANLAFYTDVLGLRLVKKTVNQDDVSAYHLFYGDESGQPGTEVTFFHWPQADANLAGPGTIERIWLAVPDEETLAWWRERLLVRGVRVAGGPGALPTDGGSGEGGRGCGGGPG
ncbi:MAG: VOC family protein, partial [Dactylosporangium sp.]|nr:VOC family protein [Dactylosporangium sp.]